MRIATAIALGSLALGAAAPARAEVGESSFTPVSFYVPLHGLALENSQTNASTILYQCPDQSGPDDDAGVIDMAEDGGPGDEYLRGSCLVDMADNSALENLFSDMIAVNPGTYDRIRVY